MFRGLGTALRDTRQRVDYILNDDFTNALAAGAIDGTDAIPGPGRRLAVDSAGKMSISGGELVIAASNPGSGDPMLIYEGMDNYPGRIIVARITPTGATTGRVGWNQSATAGTSYFAILFNTTSQLRITTNAAAPLVGAYVAGTPYEVAIATSGIATYSFIKGGAFTHWELLWIAGGATVSPIFPTIASVSSGTGLSASYIRIPTARWNPAPLLSDTYTGTVGTSDGLGHPATDQLAPGGSGLTYTSVGTWSNSPGTLSASALSGGFAITHVNLATPDTVFLLPVTRNAGDAGILARFVDTNNHITCHHNGTNVILLKKVAGVATTVQSTAVTYVAGATLRLHAVGDKFRVIYNGNLVGSEQTIADAVLQSPTRFGMYTTSTSNSFGIALIYARGTSGEYDAAIGSF